MRKRAILVAPSLAVGLALNSFAASIVEEEERKKKRLRVSSVKKENEACGAESSSLQIEKRAGPAAGGDGTNSNLLDGLSGPGSLDPEEVRENGGAEGLEGWTLPTDTLVAVKMMCQQFPKFDQMGMRPFVLRSQLYSSVSDRTVADRELEELKQQHVVRIFKLNSGKDDFGIMLKEDYVKQIEEEKRRMSLKRSEEETRVFDWFLARVVTAHTGVSIGHSHLVQRLSEAGDVTDKQISLLINSGLLVRQIADEMTYWLSIPNVGTLLKSLLGGRKELQSFLSRRRYKEMSQIALEKKRLRSSQFDMRFHIRDLIGSGHLHTVQTPTGPLIRLSRD